MADHSGEKITDLDTFDSWMTKYNQIPDDLENIDSRIDSLDSLVQQNASNAEDNSVVMAIALG